jgi:uncharacterized membrane protein
MSQTHIHLLITHLPIFGLLIGAFVLIHGIWNKSNTTLTAAYNVFIVCAITAGIAYDTGEGAEESVEHIPGIAKNIIEEHSESALLSLIGLIIIGVMAIIAIFVTMKMPAFTKLMSLIMLFGALIGFALIGRTGYLGGQIRHTEISKNLPPHIKVGPENDND